MILRRRIFFQQITMTFATDSNAYYLSTYLRLLLLWIRHTLFNTFVLQAVAVACGSKSCIPFCFFIDVTKVTDVHNMHAYQRLEFFITVGFPRIFTHSIILVLPIIVRSRQK